MNAHLVENPDKIPLVEDLMYSLQNTHRLNTSLLNRFLRASYDDEWQGQMTHPSKVQKLNVSQVKFIFQVLFENAIYADYTLVCRRINALIGSSGTGKTETSLALIAVTYCVSNDAARSAIQF